MGGDDAEGLYTLLAKEGTPLEEGEDIGEPLPWVDVFEDEGVKGEIFESWETKIAMNSTAWRTKVSQEKRSKCSAGITVRRLGASGR